MQTTILIFLVIIIVLLLANVFHRKIVGVSVMLLNVFLVVLVVAALAALFLPDVFKQFTESALSSSVLAIQLKYLDTTLTSAGSFSGGIIDSIKNLFQQGTTTNQEAYQSQLYPQLLELTTNILRWGTLIISVVLMTIITYLRFSFAGTDDTRKLRKEYKEMEARLRMLEDAQAGRIAGGTLPQAIPQNTVV